MLVLSRQLDESVVITTESGERVVVTVVAIGEHRIRLGFEAPPLVQVDRREVADAKRKAMA